MKSLSILCLVVLLAAMISAAQPKSERPSSQYVKKVSPSAVKSVEGSGDYDDDDYYDDDDDDVDAVKSDTVSKTSDDDSLEKISYVDSKDQDDDEVVDTEDNDGDDEDDDDDETTTPSSSDDITLVDEDEIVPPVEEKPTKPRKKVQSGKASGNDDLLYEYYSEYLDEDYDDLNNNNDDDDEDVVVKSGKKFGIPPVLTAASSTMKPYIVDKIEEAVDDVITSIDEAEKSAIFPPSYIFLILASALVSFTVFMLAFLACRRSMLHRQQQRELMPFVVSPATYGPPSTVVKSANSNGGSIVKNYQRVPTSTKEFLYQQQQQQQHETKEPLLT